MTIGGGKRGGDAEGIASAAQKTLKDEAREGKRRRSRFRISRDSKKNRGARRGGKAKNLHLSKCGPWIKGGLDLGGSPHQRRSEITKKGGNQKYFLRNIKLLS